MGFFRRVIGEEPNLIQQFIHGGDTGHFGEYMTEYALSNNNLKGYLKTINNIYIPYRGKTSEIDILMIHEKGFFVFESKNYSGWIFGNETQTKWTQVLPTREKNYFYNPILQNRTHIKALSQYLGIAPEHFRSAIIFSDRCELKKVPYNAQDYFIVHRKDLLKSLRIELKTKPDIFTKEQIDRYHERLYPLTQVTQAEKQKHIDEIKTAYKK